MKVARELDRTGGEAADADLRAVEILQQGEVAPALGGQLPHPLGGGEVLVAVAVAEVEPEDVGSCIDQGGQRLGPD